MSIAQTTAFYTMHPQIGGAYQRVHEWFRSDAEMCGYQHMTYKHDSLRVLARQNREDAAFNFNLYFPTHYFKVRHALEVECIIGIGKLTAWLCFNPYLTVIDVGCGDGAGSVAVIETIFRLREDNLVDPRTIQLCCIGIDRNLNGLEIYRRLMEELRDSASAHNVDIAYHIIPERIDNAVQTTEMLLQQTQTQWNQPALSHVIAIQSNLSDMLEDQYQEEQPHYVEAQQRFGYKPQPLGKNLAFLYRALFEAAPIDHLHIVTIDTNPSEIQPTIQEMALVIQNDLVKQQHGVYWVNDIELQSFRFENPPCAFWRSKKNVQAYTLDPFLVNVGHIQHRSLSQDERWQQIISSKNLELAWSRARQEALRESFCDEVEIRLFEYDLASRLERLRGELEAYAVYAGYLVDILRYKTPKNQEQIRPRGLTRFEEGILVTAIIQVIGKKVMSQTPSSFAYRLSTENTPERGDTEYLYQRWSEAWQAYRNEIEKYVRDHPRARVFQTDVSAFFERIRQDWLKEFARQEFDLSPRIQWLLGLLVSKEVTMISDDECRGLVQGSIGSGFLANIYLSKLDELFAINDAKGRRLFRYVDDTVVVIPDPADEALTKKLVIDTIDQLDLAPNPKKTGTYSVDEFIPQIIDDDLISSVRDQFEAVVTPLLRGMSNPALHEQIRHNGQSDQHWWANVRLYRGCLTELGLYVSMPSLSRNLASAIENPPDSVPTLNLPTLPSSESSQDARMWAAAFQQANPHWLESLETLRSDLVNMLDDAYSICTSSGNRISEEEKTQVGRRLRFAVNRLVYLGFEGNHVVERVVDLLCNWSWLVRSPQWWIEELARQGYEAEIWRFIEHHQDSKDEQSFYLEAVGLRAIRFFPGRVKLFDSRLTRRLFDGDILARLMATESWLMLAVMLPEVPTNEEMVKQVMHMLDATDVPDWLSKNYMLMLGLLDPTRAPLRERGRDHNPLLERAFQLASNGQIADMFKSVEPGILRQKYYSAQPPAIEDMASGSP